MKKIPSYVTEMEVRRHTRKSLLKKIVELKKTEILRRKIIQERRLKEQSEAERQKQATEDIMSSIGSGTGTDTSGEDSSSSGAIGQARNMLDEGIETAEKVAGKWDELSEIAPDIALGHYLMVSQTALKPLLYECSSNTTAPVGPEDLIRLYADITALVKQDDDNLRDTKTLAAIYAESNETMGEMLVNMFSPTDPLNWVAVVLAPFTSGGSLAVVGGIQAAKKAGQEAAEQSVRQLATSAVRREAIKKLREKGGQAVADAGQEAAAEVLTQQTKGVARTEFRRQVVGGAANLERKGLLAKTPLVKFFFSKGKLAPEQVGKLKDAVDDGVIFDVMDEIIEGGARSAREFQDLLLGKDRVKRIFGEASDPWATRAILEDNPAWQDITARYFKTVKDLDEVGGRAVTEAGKKFAKATGGRFDWIADIGSRLWPPGWFAWARSWISPRLAGRIAGVDAFEEFAEAQSEGALRDALKKALVRQYPGTSRAQAEKIVKLLLIDAADETVKNGEVYRKFLRNLDELKSIAPDSVFINLFKNAGRDGGTALSARLKQVLIDNPALLDMPMDDLLKVAGPEMMVSKEFVEEVLGESFESFAENAARQGAKRDGDTIVWAAADVEPQVFQTQAVVIATARETIESQVNQVRHFKMVSDELTSIVQDTGRRRAMALQLQALFMFGSAREITKWTADNIGFGLFDTTGQGPADAPEPTQEEIEAAAEELDQELEKIEQDKIAAEVIAASQLNRFADIQMMSDAEREEWFNDQERRAAEGDLAQDAEAESSESAGIPDPQVDDAVARVADGFGVLPPEELSAAEELAELAGMSTDSLYKNYDGWLNGLNSALNTYDSMLNSWNQMGGLNKRLTQNFTLDNYIDEMADDVGRIEFADMYVTEKAVGLFRWITTAGGLVDWHDIGDRTAYGLTWSGDILEELKGRIVTVLNSMGGINSKSYKKSSALQVLEAALEPYDISAAQVAAMEAEGKKAGLTPSQIKDNIEKVKGALVRDSDVSYGWTAKHAAVLKEMVEKAGSAGAVSQCDWPALDNAWELFTEAAAATGRTPRELQESFLRSEDEKLLRASIRKIILENKKKRLSENVAKAANFDEFLEQQSQLFSVVKDNWAQAGSFASRMDLKVVTGLPCDADPEFKRSWWLTCHNNWALFNWYKYDTTTGASSLTSNAVGCYKPRIDNTNDSLGTAIMFLGVNPTTNQIRPLKGGFGNLLKSMRSVAPFLGFAEAASTSSTPAITISSLMDKKGSSFSDDQTNQAWRATYSGTGLTLAKSIGKYLADNASGVSIPELNEGEYLLPIVGYGFAPGRSEWLTDGTAVVKSNWVNANEFAERIKAEGQETQQAISDLASEFEGVAESERFMIYGPNPRVLYPGVGSIDMASVTVWSQQNRAISGAVKGGTVTIKPGMTSGAGGAVWTPLFVNPDSGDGVRDSITNSFLGQLAQEVYDVMTGSATIITKKIDDEDITGNVSDGEETDEESDSGEGDGNIEMGTSPEAAREKFIEKLETRNQYADSQIVVINPKRNSRIVNDYVLEFSIAAYLVKHGLEENLENWAPDFWEGFYTAYQKSKGAKINQTIGDFPNLDKVFYEILKHAKSKRIGIMKDPNVRSLVSATGTDWDDMNRGLADLGYNRYVDQQYLDRSETDFYGWANFMRDLANGYNIPGPGSEPEVVKESRRRQRVVTSRAYRKLKK